MAVGVPENDVFAAANAVLARGERPTVERVRLELGRGSPARVGALLDQWWEQLAGRLRGERRLPGLPTEVAQAFVAIWQQATTLAQGLADEREALGALEARARLEVAQARQQTAEAVSARQGVEIRLADLDQLLVQRQAQIDDLIRQRDELQAQRDDSRHQSLELQQQLLDSREQAERARDEQQRYTRDVEDRAYREIDRAREESKSLAVQLKDAGTRLQSLQQDLQAGQTALAEAREQRGVAQAQRDQLQLAQAAVCEHLQALQQQDQLRHRELVELREQAAASRALAELLRQQLAEVAAGHPTEGRSRPVRTPSRKK